MLRGKIAAIANEDSVVINLGSEDGVKPGMNFLAVYETVAITDPDNPDKELGGLTFKIADLQAASVLPQMTLCNILDPYAYAYQDPFAGMRQKTLKKIDPMATQIAGSEHMKLKVGTIVVEAPPEASKGQTADQESPPS